VGRAVAADVIVADGDTVATDVAEAVAVPDEAGVDVVVAGRCEVVAGVPQALASRVVAMPSAARAIRC